MAEKKPLCVYAGEIKELQSGDTLPGGSAAATSFQQTFVNADLSSGILTVTHDLDQQIVQVVVEDNNSKPVLPDEITFTSTSALSLDISGHGTITGTWTVRVIRGLDTDVPAGYSTTFTNASLSAGVLTVTHNLNKTPVVVVIADNNSKQIIPDDITFSSNNEIAVDLTQFGTLTGTWSVFCK